MARAAPRGAGSGRPPADRRADAGESCARAHEGGRRGGSRAGNYGGGSDEDAERNSLAEERHGGKIICEGRASSERRRSSRLGRLILFPQKSAKKNPTKIKSEINFAERFVSSGTKSLPRRANGRRLQSPGARDSS